MLAWQERAQMIILGAMSTNKCSKIAPLFEIQHDVLFRRISYSERAVGMCVRSQKENKT